MKKILIIILIVIAIAIGLLAAFDIVRHLWKMGDESENAFLIDKAHPSATAL